MCDTKRYIYQSAEPESKSFGADIEADVGGNIVKNKLNNRFKVPRMALMKHQMMLGKSLDC